MMHAWEQIQQTIEFIELHLDENLNIESLAKMASLSPFYYQRLFSQLVKKPELQLHYTLVDEGMPLITDGIVLEIRREKLMQPIQFIGLVKKMPVDFIQGLGIESGVDPLDTLWREFHNKKVTDLNLEEDSQEIGVTYPCSDIGYFHYFAGGKDNDGTIPPGYETWKLPSGDYVVCTFESENFEALVMDALYKAQQYIFNTWLPNHKLKTAAFCAERYRSHTPETTSMEVWLLIEN